MEYCGGGSLQDIYHGTLKFILTFVPLGSFLQRREINNKQTNRDGWFWLGTVSECLMQEQVICFLKGWEKRPLKKFTARNPTN